MALAVPVDLEPARLFLSPPELNTRLPLERVARDQAIAPESDQLLRLEVIPYSAPLRLLAAAVQEGI
jgi:hypothetical protein